MICSFSFKELNPTIVFHKVNIHITSTQVTAIWLDFKQAIYIYNMLIHSCIFLQFRTRNRFLTFYVILHWQFVKRKIISTSPHFHQWEIHDTSDDAINFTLLRRALNTATHWSLSNEMNLHRWECSFIKLIQLICEPLRVLCMQCCDNLKMVLDKWFISIAISLHLKQRIPIAWHVRMRITKFIISFVLSARNSFFLPFEWIHFLVFFYAVKHTVEGFCTLVLKIHLLESYIEFRFEWYAAEDNKRENTYTPNALSMERKKKTHTQRNSSRHATVFTSNVHFTEFL